MEDRAVMGIGKRLLCASCLLLVASCGDQHPSAGQPTEQARSMERVLADIETVRAFVGGTASQSDALAAAKELTAWSARMRELFPPKQVMQLYVDLPPEMAEAAPEAMRRTSTQLALAVATGRIPEVKQALATTETDGCGACHRHGYK
jgi:hypothetical protein